MATAGVETSLLASFISVPEISIHNLVTSPTQDLIISFLQTLGSKAQEYNQLKSERLRLDVELENAIRGSETKTKILKANTDAALREATALKSQLADEEKRRTEVEEQLEALRTSTSSSSGESKALQGQISRLERSNRDTLSLLTAKSEAHDRLAEELALSHQKSTASRQEIAALEERNRSSENALSSAKYREQALQSEVERLQRNSEWLDAELKTKNSEHTKFRKEKNARTAELQRANEDARQTIESAQRTESALRKRLDEMGQKADETFTKIQQLQENASRKDEDFRAEIETSRRLADLQQQSAETHRRRVHELEQQIEQIKDDAAAEIGQVQSELETERQGREASERRIEELESGIQRLESELSTAQQGDETATPRRRTNGLGIRGTPGRAGSPSPFSPGTSLARAGISFTQLFSEHNSLKAELLEERRTHANLRSTFDELMAELQQKEPELQQTQEDRDNFEAQVTQLSGLLEDARQERDLARKEARKSVAQAKASEHKAKLLEQQVRDLSVQVKVLLVEMQIREQGGQIDPAQRERLRQAARGFDELHGLEGMTDTDQYISQDLVAFKDVFELQKNHENCLKIVRKLGNKFEEQEANEKDDLERKHLELDNLRERVERYQDEMKALVTQSQSYVRERDMFRRMLMTRGQLPADGDMEAAFGQSLNGGPPVTPRPMKDIPGVDSAASKDAADYVTLLKELQSHFDAYRQETSSEYSSAKAQVEKLTKEKNQLQGDIIRANSHVTLAQERYQMLLSNFELQKSGNAEILKRSNALSEAAAKQDMRTQQAAEDLVEAQSFAEGLRSENSNLKAEKELWKRIETRLGEDNRTLLEEKSRLNKIITDTQNLANERELTDSETRRRLQAQVEALDVDLRKTRIKLEEEIDSSKNAALRREYEQEQNRTRIDDLVKSLSNVKEELIAAKTTRDQLQSRIEEMRIELRSAEDRAQALQPRANSRPHTQAANGDDAMEADSLTREQQLGVEVVEVKRELELAKADLENARLQMEQYRTISQSAEEELSSLNEAHDEYRNDADGLLSVKEAKIKDLEQRLQDTSAELSTATEQLNELRSTANDHNTRLEQQRAAFEAQLAQVQDECERYKETSDFHQQDLKAQAEVAQQAQQSYENELVKHAEAAKSLKKVRDELNEVKLEVSTATADAEAARLALGQSQESWASTRDTYEKELADARTSRSEIDAQNTLLHAQLESIGSQIAALQQKRAAPADGEDTEHSGPASDLQNLQQVINYLRREKEIVDVQYELSVQEARRLKQQLDYTQSQLDESRLRLEQERQRQTDRENGNNSHTKLMETLNELNVFRSSSVTLRNEARQAQTQLAAKTKEVEDLMTQIQPLQISIREFEAERETMQGEMKLLEEDRNASQQRIQNILQKYNRIDPAELEGLKEQIKTLETERDAIAETSRTLQVQVDGFPADRETAQKQARDALKESLSVQFKTRSKELSQQINAARTENTNLSQQLELVQTELELATKARDEAVTRVEVAEAETASRTFGTEPTTSVPADIQERLTAAETLAGARQKEIEAAAAESVARQAEMDQLRSQITDLQARLEVANNELSSLRIQNSPTSENVHLEKLRSDLSAAQTELESFRSSANTELMQIGQQAPASSSSDEEVEKRVQARLEDEADKRSKEKIDSMKAQLNNKLRDGRKAYQDQINAERDTQIQQIHDKVDALEKALVEASAAKVAAETAAAATTATATTIPAQPAANSTSSTLNNAAPATEGDETLDENSIVKLKMDTTLAPNEWTWPQVTAFVQNNPHVSKIVSRSVTKQLQLQLAKERETAAAVKAAENQLETQKSIIAADVSANSGVNLEAKLEEARLQAETELKEKTEDLQKKFDKAKEQAVFMEGKKFGVKVSILETKARNAVFKVEFVEKAAAETPQRPVAEVWNLVKDLKAPPAPPAAPASTPATPVGKPAPPLPKGSITTASTTTASPAAAEKEIPQPLNPTTEAANSPKANGNNVAPSQGSTLRVPNSTLPSVPANRTAGSNIPQPGAAARGGSYQSSNIPRGGGIPRGNTTNTRGSNTGRGRGRGGLHHMNPGAPPSVSQQSSGSKRPREDSVGPGPDGNKRARGGYGQGQG